MTVEDAAPTRFENLRVWQRLVGEWTDTRIPLDNLSWRGLVLGEEGGEVLEEALRFLVATAKVQRCILKAEQDIRGGRERWLGELPDEVADAFFCLAAIAHRAGFDLGDAVASRWTVLAARTIETEQEHR